MILTVAVVGAGVVGGVYAGFATLVIPALKRLEAPAATAAMVTINRVAERGPFVAVFGAVALAAVALAASTNAREAPEQWWVAAASLSSTVVTVAVNVPLNRRLEREGAVFWDRYARRWGAANTVRAVLASAAVVLAGTAWR
ncbi:DUF1772 domain-containing protein [Zhihengliuella halotolerans]|uniref:Putative membrane protein n=1 Tax=Zhihengliuella halotolerans TaxID=370736 RepID=A0A4Q8AEZ7_9MICC|nr:DUF1772 domain-containing protein [Zhihengliuella halotolerans]RZU62862.1 putative membrane protein [Zhihengliuella halotolerans]